MMYPMLNQQLFKGETLYCSGNIKALDLEDISLCSTLLQSSYELCQVIELSCLCFLIHKTLKMILAAYSPCPITRSQTSISLLLRGSSILPFGCMPPQPF
jgi:hypothetical protein